MDDRIQIKNKARGQEPKEYRRDEDLWSGYIDHHYYTMSKLLDQVMKFSTPTCFEITLIGEISAHSFS